MSQSYDLIKGTNDESSFQMTWTKGNIRKPEGIEYDKALSPEIHNIPFKLHSFRKKKSKIKTRSGVSEKWRRKKCFIKDKVASCVCVWQHVAWKDAY